MTSDRIHTVRFELAHVRAAEKALALVKGIRDVQERVYLGAGCTDETLTVEFLEELVERMRGEMVDETASRRVDFARHLGVVQ